MLAITVSSAIMGFELPEKARGPRAGFGEYVPRRPRGPGLHCDVKCESEQGVTELASGKTVPTGRVCHVQINELLSQTFTGSFSALH